jgi:hypothetical protein
MRVIAEFVVVGPAGQVSRQTPPVWLLQAQLISAFTNLPRGVNVVFVANAAAACFSVSKAATATY